MNRIGLCAMGIGLISCVGIGTINLLMQTKKNTQRLAP